MMEGFDKNDELNEEMDGKFKQEIYSKAVRAGKRTYFFDVKSTRKDEYYLTITESKKRYEQDGKFHFEKHKIFLYKEDFEKFADGLNEVVDFIVNQQPYDETSEREYYREEEVVEEKPKMAVIDVEDELELEDEELVKDYTNVEFEDLNN
ncbi:DUF3276 family protein [Mangrovibacterium diazotrophicum]|uniref:Uncharacterized protein DUF3276 n=1 Tax=Mangrovibacterium diazotrophicum TaxID=1261403 RepID=A0A419VYC6_9BACT|nr:DUF3276 family protein [Mangrovibacterium diazotrophicum]RKD88212.1 uncharacterized protein DUF3276 [Mangrovibacterium diazotrophicum]